MPLLGGVRPPIAALLSLLLAIAAFTGLGIGTSHDERVPSAVREAERQIAADAAASIGTSIRVRAAALRHLTAGATPAAGSTSETALKALLPTGHYVRGAALINPKTGGTVAATGEHVPLFGVAVQAMAGPGSGTAIAPRLVVARNIGPRLLLFARVTVPADALRQHSGDRHDQQSGGRQFVVAVSETLAAPATYGGGRTTQLVDRDGTVLARTAGAGTSSGTRTGDRSLPLAAATKADATPHTPDASGSLLADHGSRPLTVAGWASVAGADGTADTADLGLTVLTSTEFTASKSSADHTRFATEAAGALVVIALLTTVLLRMGMQRPLLRLHLSAARLVRGVCDTSGRSEELDRPVPASLCGEAARAVRALESIRRQLHDDPPLQTSPLTGWRAFGTRTLLLCCALLIAAWSLPMLFLANRVDPAKAVPATVVADQRARTEAAAERVGQLLGQSYTDLVATASEIAGEPAARQTDILRHTLADHRQYRSMYILHRTGTIVLREGKQPLRTLVHTPTGSGVTRINTSGKVPAIAAYAQIPAARHTKTSDAVVLFGEIDVNALNRLLSRPGLGTVWLSDERRRVLAATVGFRAFQPLPGRGLGRLAAMAENTPKAGGSSAAALLGAGTSSSVAAAAPLPQTGPYAGLGWRVISDVPASTLKLTAYQVQSYTVLAGLLALVVGAACLGWLYIMVVQPLRTLAGCAERVADGDQRTVLYPVHHDECGSVIRSLELLRQVLAQRRRGSHRAPVPTQSSWRSAPEL